MVTPDQLSNRDISEAVCEKHKRYTCSECEAEAKKSKFEVIEGGKEEKEKLEVGVYTEASSSHPERNEDQAFADDEKAGVFDGMGGENAGDVASVVASEAIKAELDAIPDNATLDQKVAAMEHAFHAAHQAIIDNVAANPEYKGMGTTATVTLRHEGPEGSKLIVGNVGDSRVYRVEGGQATLETNDDSIANYLVENGILDNDQDLDQPIPDNIKNNPVILATFKKPPETLSDIRRGVTQAIGRNEIKPNISVLDANPGSRFVLTSDGIHDHLTDEEIGSIGSKDKSPNDISEEMVSASKTVFEDESNPRRKPDDDDKTAVVIDIPKKEVSEALAEIAKMNLIDDEIELSDKDLEQMAV